MEIGVSSFDNCSINIRHDTGVILSVAICFDPLRACFMLGMHQDPSLLSELMPDGFPIAPRWIPPILTARLMLRPVGNPAGAVAHAYAYKEEGGGARQDGATLLLPRHHAACPARGPSSHAQYSG